MRPALLHFIPDFIPAIENVTFELILSFPAEYCHQVHQDLQLWVLQLPPCGGI